MDTTIETSLAEEVGLFTSRITDTFSAELAPARQGWVVRAPGRLDVMGGIAEHSGSVTLTVTTAGAVFAASAARNDQRVVVDALEGSGNGHDVRTEWPLELFYAGLNELADADTLFKRIEKFDAAWAYPAAVALHGMLRHGIVPHLGGGLTLVFHSSLPPSAGVGCESAVHAATIGAAAAAMNVNAEPARVATLCRGLRVRCPGESGGASGVHCTLLGEPGTLLQMRLQPQEQVSHLRLPRGLTVIGVESGYRHPAAQRKYVDARVATFMGQAFVEQAMRGTGQPGAGWNGFLAQITISDYVSRFRDRIPTKIKGQAFLERFQDTGCPHARVNPATIYKIRSRTEHHIYENDRAHQFVERLSRAARTAERSALIEAGELMYASHWSYGQRCGLGTVATDVLVTRLRQRGPADGVYGARVSGHGCGGVVVALIDDSDRARAAVASVADAYQTETGNRTCLIEAASPGVFITKPRPFSLS